MALTEKEIKKLMIEVYEKYVIPNVKFLVKKAEERGDFAVSRVTEFLTDEEGFLWTATSLINELKKVERLRKRVEALERGGVLPPKSHAHCHCCGAKLK